MINIKKELTVFTVLLLVSSLIVHISEWLSHPFEHMGALFDHPMPYHPILYVILIYIVLLVFRGIFALIKKNFTKK